MEESIIMVSERFMNSVYTEEQTAACYVTLIKASKNDKKIRWNHMKSINMFSKMKFIIIIMIFEVFIVQFI